MTSRIGVLLACVLVCAACGKKKDKGADNAPGSAEAKTEEVAAAPSDPWAAPPEEANTKFGAQLGDELSKIDPKADDAGGGGRLAQMSKKIEAGQITKPVESGVELKAFGNIETTGFSLTYNPSKDPTHEQYRTRRSACRAPSISSSSTAARSTRSMTRTRAASSCATSCSTTSCRSSRAT
jgi:hypothetical protein